MGIYSSFVPCFKKRQLYSGALAIIPFYSNLHTTFLMYQKRATTRTSQATLYCR